MFYSCFNVTQTIFKLLLPSFAPTLLPLTICFAGVCAIGAFTAFYGVTAVAIRKKFRVHYPISDLKDKAELTMKIIKLREIIGKKNRNYFEKTILNKMKLRKKIYNTIKESVMFKVKLILQNKEEGNEAKSSTDWCEKFESLIQNSFNEILIRYPISLPKQSHSTERNKSLKSRFRSCSFTK